MSRLETPGRTPLARRFLVAYAMAYVVLIGATAWLVVRSVEDAFVSAAAADLGREARLAAESLPESPGELDGWAERVFQATGRRVTVIDGEGVVLADSHQNPAVMENHGTRPEVLAARETGTGRDTRLSRSTGFEQLYVAVVTDDGLVLRLSVPTRELSADLSPVVGSIVVITIVVGLIGIGIVALLARRMAEPISRLTQQTLALAEGNEVPSIRRSNVRELDRLGRAIARLEEDKERRLVESERAAATLEVVLGALPQGTVLFDEGDAVVYANPAAGQLLGVVPDVLAGLAPHPFQTAVRECRRTRETETVTVEHGKPARVLRGIATPFRDDDRVLLVVADVTERERAASVRRDFVANASHELKTPVASIVASVDALRIAVERGDGSAVRFAEQIEASARQLDRLVSDLLDLSRLERDRPESDPLRLDLLVEEEVERTRPLAEGSGIDLALEAAPARVAGSRRDVAIAVRNLLDNAVHYTPPGGSITVTVKTVEGEAVLQVSDTGEGIPTRDLGRVFERFYRVDSARSRATGGTGLGLAIVKHVAESHGGGVDVESELGAGSVFTLRLPLLGGDISLGG